jgi:hypothetical protein
MLAARWVKRLPESYRAAVDPRLAAEDVGHFEELVNGDADFRVGLQEERGADGARRTRVAFYRRGAKVELSQATPMLEHLGLRVIEEIPARLHADEELWIQAFGVLGEHDQPLDLDECDARVADALEIVRALSQRQLEGSIHVIVGFVELIRGDWAACRARAAEMRAIAQAIGAPYIDAMSRTAEGYAVAVGGGDPAGIEMLRDAVAAIDGSGSRISFSVNCGCLAEALALHGRVEEATDMALRSLDRAAAGDRVGEGQARRALGIAAARKFGPGSEASRTEFAESLALTDRRGSTRESAVTRLRWAEQLSDVDPESARRLVADAAVAFTTFRMPWYAEAAARLQARLGAA